MNDDVWKKTIDDPNAPPRLIGKTIVAIIDMKKNKLEFKADLPDDATAQEIGYFKWFIGELVDGFPIPGKMTGPYLESALQPKTLE